MLIQVLFWIFAALTLIFALALLWGLIKPRTIPVSPLPGPHLALLHALAAEEQSPKALAEALEIVLKSLADFGSKLDTLGPTALLGIFTVIFALCAIGCGWIARIPC